jgi:hypothetical protein
MGWPQPGQLAAALEIERPQAGQVVSVIPADVSGAASQAQSRAGRDFAAPRPTRHRPDPRFIGFSRVAMKKAAISSPMLK